MNILVQTVYDNSKQYPNKIAIIANNEMISYKNLWNSILQYRSNITKCLKEKFIMKYLFNALQNGATATQNIMLVAHSLGIGSVWVNALYSTCEEPALRTFLTSLGVPQNHLIVSTICLGYPETSGTKFAKKQNVISWNE